MTNQTDKLIHNKGFFHYIITACIEGFKQFNLCETGINYALKVELKTEISLSKHYESFTGLN